MAAKRSAALVFVTSDSGEQYITVDKNEGDRCVMPLGKWRLAANPLLFSKNLTAWHGGDDLILAVAAQNNNTIVIVNSVGPLILEPWIEHPNVSAVRILSSSLPVYIILKIQKQVVWAGIPGQEAGNALTDILYGAWNPSGRLPYTIAKSISDYPAQLITGGGPDDILSMPYTEG